MWARFIKHYFFFVCHKPICPFISNMIISYIHCNVLRVSCVHTIFVIYYSSDCCLIDINEMLFIDMDCLWCKRLRLGRKLEYIGVVPLRMLQTYTIWTHTRVVRHSLVVCACLATGQRANVMMKKKKKKAKNHTRAKCPKM